MTDAELRTGVLDVFVRECFAAGLDIVHPFQVQHFNAIAVGAERLPDFGRPALAAVVGNTKYLWPRFLAALEAEPDRRSLPHPLDSYVQERVNRACELVEVRTSVFWSHVTEPRAVPIQRIAQAAGLAVITPSHFSIHALYGCWLALRAVVVFDIDGPGDRPRLMSSPCESCSQPCMPALNTALAMAERRGEPLHLATHSDWRHWALVREVCPIGRAYVYSAPQLEYHYTKNPRLLGRG
jgi:methylmalonic aciduria homocystinuria type C protein